MPGDQRPAPSLFVRFLRFFFYLIYEPMAWSYDFVAWVVSLGRWKSWVKSTLPELPGRRVLELGHGPGHLQIALHEKGLRTFGIDRSATMGRLAYRRLTNSKRTPYLVRATAEKLPFASAVFNQLVATFPSEYIVQKATLAESHRVLTNEGKLVVLPVAWIRGNRLWDRAAAWLFRVTGQAGTWDTRYSDPLRSAGFSLEEKLVNTRDSEIMLIIASIR